MSVPDEIRHVMRARSYIGATAQFSFMPWTGTHPQDFPYMGWQIDYLDPDEPARYLYFYPNLEAERPVIGVYYGKHGDHTKDRCIGEMEGLQTDE